MTKRKRRRRFREVRVYDSILFEPADDLPNEIDIRLRLAAEKHELESPMKLVILKSRGD